MKSIRFRSIAPVVSLAGTLCLMAPGYAHLHNGFPNHIQHMRLDNSGSNNREIRQISRNDSDANRVKFTPSFQVPDQKVHHLHELGNRLNRSTVRSAYLMDNGVARAFANGLELDLTSTDRSIVLGEQLFPHGGAYTIKLAGEERTLTSGSKVSAAEYVALQQVINSGSQTLTLDQSGRGVDGQFSLNTITDGGKTIRATELVIPEHVTASGDFSRHSDGIRVTNDLVNYGTIEAFSSNKHVDTARIAARDIDNNAGATISTSAEQLKLYLHADRDINNSGLISSSGDLELTAGRSITNHGSINSNANITINGNSDADLHVNNTGGTISALNGAINVRSADYAGIGNTTVSGGNLYSRELNLFTGLGTTDVVVNQLTGVINTSGTGAHVSANTETLTIGSQCLLGDPVYYNTGSIVIAGDILVGEDLAIIAGGDITSGLANLTIATRDVTGKGFSINMIAGANVVAGSGEVSPAGGPGVLPAQPPTTQNTTADVIFSTNSASGGNIDLSGVTTKLVIDSSSGSSNFDGGSITLAAFANGSGAKGRVLLPTTSATINASGNGTGNNGNILIAAGGQNVLGIKLPSNTSSIIDNGGTGTGAGRVQIITAQPETSDGKPITFNTSGIITSGNKIDVSVTANPAKGSTLEVGNIQMGPTVLNIDSDDDIDIHGNVDVVGTATGTAGGKIFVNSGGTINQTGRMSVDGANGKDAGSIQLFASSSSPVTIDNLTGQGGTLGGNGGFIIVQNFGSGGINLSKSTFGTILANAPAGDGGTVQLLAKNNQLTSLTDFIVDAGGKNANGSIIVTTTDLLVANGSLRLTANSGTNGGISISTTTGGISVGANKFEALSAGALDLQLTINVIDANTSLGNAGTIDIEAATMILHTSKTNPLLLRASALNGDGGKVLYADQSTTPTFIGNGPTKLPKGTANFLALEAVAFTNGAGGSISLLSGGILNEGDGALLVNANSTGGPQKGGTIQLAGAIGLTKGGSVVIRDALNVNGVNGGTGGTVFLIANSTKPFVLNSTKTPKNGTVASISAQGGVDGTVTVQNRLGGVTVANSNAIKAGDVTLQAFGKGNISESKSVLLTASDSVNAISQVGAINLTVAAPVISFQSAGGNATIVDTLAAPTILLDSAAGNGATVRAAGPLTVGRLDVTGNLGVITGSTNAGSLNLTGNIKVTNGSLTIENDDTAQGTIDIADSTTIETAGSKGGVVNIVIGAVPKKPLNSDPPFTAPPEFTVTPTGKGQVFFGVNPTSIVTSIGNSVTLEATNKNLVLNNASTNFATKKIIIGNLVRISADPPSKN